MPEDVRTLPIREIDFSNPEEVRIHNKLVNLVDGLLALNQEISAMKEGTNELSEAKKKIEENESEINKIVFNLYNLNEREIKVIKKI